MPSTSNAINALIGGYVHYTVTDGRMDTIRAATKHRSR